MKSTIKRIKLDLNKLVGFNQTKSISTDSVTKLNQSMIGASKNAAMIGQSKTVSMFGRSQSGTTMIGVSKGGGTPAL